MARSGTKRHREETVKTWQEIKKERSGKTEKIGDLSSIKFFKTKTMLEEEDGEEETKISVLYNEAFHRNSAKYDTSLI
jgi:hypothetical protein